jgi:hypothetical protein
MFRVLLVAALLPAAAAAADLSKIDRTLRKEPKYENSPKYCLLVFGPKADFRVWVVQDGDVLYVDRNGNGDLTDKDDRVKAKNPGGEFRLFEAGSVSDGTLTHTGLVVTCSKTQENHVADAREWKRVNAQKGGPMMWTVRVQAERPAEDARKLPKRIGYIANGDQNGNLLFADRPEDAPVVHFNGPWALGLQDWKCKFAAGQKTMLQIGVGTFGVGPGSFSFVLYPDTIPAAVYPVAEISFPGKEKGGEPIKLKYTLKERC